MPDCRFRPDIVHAVPNGPYILNLQLHGGGRNGGELFYTTDPETTPPHGGRVEFDIRADGTWQPITLELPTSDRLQQLRIDVSPGPGEATIAELKLTDADGNQVMVWPAVGSNQ